MWATAASLHMDDNAEKWLQVYKRKHGLGTWKDLIKAVEQKFGAYDYQHAIDGLLELQQTGTVEEYVSEFEALQYQVAMHDLGMADTYFVSQFIKGLKPEIRYSVQGQVPGTMEKAVMLAKMQQIIQEKYRSAGPKSAPSTRYTPSTTPKPEYKSTPATPQLSKERQLRDYCRANNLCFYCREPYDPSHAAKCTKRPKTQVNALVLNDLDVTLNDEVLKQLEIEDALTEEFCTLSLNALAGTEHGEAMKLRSLVKNKVFLLLVDSGSSHSFVSSAFLQKVGIVPVPAPPKKVRVANGDILISDKCVPGLQWWIQGYSFVTPMRVLDMPAYDDILVFDWLSANSPITHHWDNKTMSFEHKGLSITLQGVQPMDLSLQELPVDRLQKWLVGNDVWALAAVTVCPPDSLPEHIPEPVRPYWLLIKMCLLNLRVFLQRDIMTMLFLFCPMLFLSTLNHTCCSCQL